MDLKMFPEDIYLYFASVIVFAIIVIYLELKYDILVQITSRKQNLDTEDNGGDLVAKVLMNHEVSHIFTLVGGHISPILVAAEKIGIKVIDTRHEATCVFAADAFSRLSGKIGVAVVTAGPGVTNTITALKNAQMAETPLLLLGGATATLLKGRGALQDIDQLSLIQSVCKYYKSVRCVRHIVPVLQKAIQAAFSDTPGPVFVELPVDILYPYKTVKKEMKIKDNPRGLFQNLVNLYMERYLYNLFAGAFINRDTGPLPVQCPTCTNDIVEKCILLVNKAEKPLILIGSQALIPPKLSNCLRQALGYLNIPCFLGGMARGLLGHNSPLHIRQKRKEALNEADLVILAGTTCDFRLSYGRILNSKSKIIAVNRNKSQLNKNSDMFWKATVSIQASPSDFLLKLASKSNMDTNLARTSWINKLRQRDAVTENENRAKISLEPSAHLDPVQMLYQLEDVLPNNTILIADGGDFVATASYILRPRGALKWLDPGAFGTLGVGAGFALGAKTYSPDATVVIIYGDGSCGYSIVEFDTFVRHKLPVLAVVGNDACWTQIAREQVPSFNSAVACNLSFTDYHKVVEGFGAKGFILKGDDINNLENIFKTAINLSIAGESVLINALIGKSDFRSGSLSI